MRDSSLMTKAVIAKSSEQRNWANYNETTSAVDWQAEVDKLFESRRGFMNMAFETIDVHLSDPESAKRVALRFVGKAWPREKQAVREITYRELYEQSCKFANGLQALGVKKGDAVFALSPRLPELYVTVLGTLRAGAVFSPLFSAFGPEPILARMQKGEGSVLFSLASFYRKKVEPIRSQLSQLRHLILVDDDGSLSQISGAIDFHEFMKQASSTDFVERTGPEDRALLHFTSGTTGRPKGAIHVHAAIVYHRISGQLALDVKPGDVFWCTADPGWVTGISYGILSPLSNGATLLIDESEFQAQRWYQILDEFQVTVWYTAPTAMRMLMKAGPEMAKGFSRQSVRLAASVGEPLNPEVIQWSKENLGLPMHDNWWQSETGGIMVSNYLAMDIRLGSMGKPMPGAEVRLARRSCEDKIEFVTEPGTEGEIVIKAGWPSMFRGYLGDEERYQKCFRDGWYFSGDLATLDKDGYFWFVGRSDDVIKSSGHLVGPFEVESALMEHPAVLEAAVIGKPDPVAGEMIKAFVVLKGTFTASEEQQLDILAFARKRLGVAVAPREIAFIENLPKTRSGKIMRRLLKARELGLPEGDISTLESN